MAEDEIVLASAVVVPEPEASPPPSPPIKGSRKRRQSSVASTDSKRPRILHNDSTHRRGSATTPPPANGAQRARPVRNQSGKEERQRGKRLFGALLGNLGQSRPPTAAQRRRAEIEQKQQEKLRQQGEEDEAERRERLEKLERRRRREQWGWEEGSMKARHRSLRARAGMLRTRAEPVLYYLPYETTKEEEEAIRRQKDEVEDDIAQEVEEFSETRRVALEQLGLDGEEDTPTVDQRHELETAYTNGHTEEVLAGEPDEKSREVERKPSPTPETNGDSKDDGSDGNTAHTDELSKARAGAADSKHSDSPEQPLPGNQDVSHDAHRDVHDDTGEVVEGDEDAVIY